MDTGGYAVVPAKTPHWILAKEDSDFVVFVNGPRDLVYINPADDPKNKK